MSAFIAATQRPVIEVMELLAFRRGRERREHERVALHIVTNIELDRPLTIAPRSCAATLGVSGGRRLTWVVCKVEPGYPDRARAGSEQRKATRLEGEACVEEEAEFRQRLHRHIAEVESREGTFAAWLAERDASGWG